jgi:hypothetical protein
MHTFRVVSVARLIAADDGYEPARTAATMKQLYERDQVFGLVGNVGTTLLGMAGIVSQNKLTKYWCTKAPNFASGHRIFFCTLDR